VVPDPALCGYAKYTHRPTCAPTSLDIYFLLGRAQNISEAAIPHSCSPPSALAVPKVMQIFVKDVTTLAFDVEDGCTVEQLKMRFTQRAFGVDAAASWVSRLPSHAVLQCGPLRQLRWLHAASGVLPEWAQSRCAGGRCMPSTQLLCTCLQGRIRPSTTLHRPSLSISLSLFCC
jgi:hypothetical protein